MTIYVTSVVRAIILGDINGDGTNEIVGVSGSQSIQISSSLLPQPITYTINVNWKEDMKEQWDTETPNPNRVRGEYPSPAGDSFPVTVVPASRTRGYTLSVPNGEDGIFIHLAPESGACRLEGCFVVDQEILDILHCATRESNITITLTHEIIDAIENYDEYKAQYPGSVWRPPSNEER